MATESDLIRRYRGAFSSDDCKKIIEYINVFEKSKLLINDRDNLHQVDHSTINVAYDYDFPTSSKISTLSKTLSPVKVSIVTSVTAAP